MFDISKLNLDKYDAKIFDIKYCEELRDNLVIFENAIKTLWWYLTDNRIDTVDLPEELLEAWGAICMYGIDNDDYISILSNPIRLKAWIASQKYVDKLITNGKLTEEEEEENKKLMAIYSNDAE